MNSYLHDHKTSVINTSFHYSGLNHVFFVSIPKTNCYSVTLVVRGYGMELCQLTIYSYYLFKATAGFHSTYWLHLQLGGLPQFKTDWFTLEI